MDANDKQIGGEHYKGRPYEHWDWVCDIDLHYLLACATKYVFRWRSKNGVQDLDKAVHFLEKAMERHLPDPCPGRVYAPENTRFLRSIENPEDADAILQVIQGHYMGAITRIEKLKVDAELS